MKADLTPLIALAQRLEQSDLRNVPNNSISIVPEGLSIKREMWVRENGIDRQVIARAFVPWVEIEEFGFATVAIQLDLLASLMAGGASKA